MRILAALCLLRRRPWNPARRKRQLSRTSSLTQSGRKHPGNWHAWSGGWGGAWDWNGWHSWEGSSTRSDWESGSDRWDKASDYWETSSEASGRKDETNAATSQQVRGLLQRPLTSLSEFEELDREAAEIAKDLEVQIKADEALPARAIGGMDTQTTLVLGESQYLQEAVEATQEIQPPPANETMTLADATLKVPQQTVIPQQVVAASPPSPKSSVADVQQKQQDAGMPDATVQVPQSVIPQQVVAASPPSPKSSVADVQQKQQDAGVPNATVQVPQQPVIPQQVAAASLPSPQSSVAVQQQPQQDASMPDATEVPQQSVIPQQVVVPSLPSPQSSVAVQQKPQQDASMQDATAQVPQQSVIPQQVVAASLPSPQSSVAVQQPQQDGSMPDATTQVPQESVHPVHIKTEPGHDPPPALEARNPQQQQQQQGKQGHADAAAGHPDDKWRRDKYGNLLSAAALYSKFYRSVRGLIPSSQSVYVHACGYSVLASI